jgi:hypothetical protein
MDATVEPKTSDGFIHARLCRGRQLSSRATDASWARVIAVTLRIEGHADDSGDPCFNLSLSMRRVRKVMHWLVANCIAAERLEPLACGRRYAEQGSRSVNVQTTAACRRSGILRRCRAARPLRPIEPK